jgi:hypothetical protein
MPLPIQKSAANNCITIDLEIGSQKLYECRFRNQQLKTLSLLIQRSGPKLCCRRFRNRQPIIVSLPIHNRQLKTLLMSILKSAANNCVAVDFEIGNKKLCRCRFKNR